MSLPDMIVIGGGAIGLSTAWCAARCGARVTLLERGQLGRESSWAAAGILPFSRVERARTPYARAMAESSRLHPLHAETLHAETGVDVGYAVCGELLGALDPADHAWLAHEIERQGDAGATVVAENTANAALRLAEVHRVRETAQLRPPRYLRALELACRARGVRIHTETAVAQLIQSGDRVLGAASASGQRFHGEVTVLAAGAWSPQLAGTPLDVRPIRGQIALLRAREPLPEIISVDHRYLVPRPDGRVLVGATMEDVGFDGRTTLDGVRGLLEFAARLMPALADAEVEHSWAGLRPGTPSGEPYVGLAPERRGLWLATGHTRQGIHLAPHTGEWIAAQALGAPSTLGGARVG